MKVIFKMIQLASALSSLGCLLLLGAIAGYEGVPGSVTVSEDATNAPMRGLTAEQTVLDPFMSP